MNTELIRLERMVRRAQNPEQRCDALCRYAEAMRRHDPAQVPALLEEALELARQKGYRRGEAFALAIQGLVEFQRSAGSSGPEYLEQAQRIAEAIDDEELLCKLLVARAYIHLGHGERDQALHCADQAYRIARSAGDISAEADALLMLTKVHGELMNFTGAEAALRRAQRIIIRNNDRVRLTSLSLYRGLLHSTRSEIPDAIQSLATAAELARETGNRIDESTALLAMGRAYDSIGDYPNAVRHLMNCSEVAGQVGAVRTQLHCLLEIAGVHQRFGDVERARQVAEQVLQVAREHGKRGIEATALNVLGELSQHMDDLDGARGFYEAASVIGEDEERIDIVGNSLLHIGNVLRSRKNYDEALVYYQRSMAIAEKLGDRNAVTFILIDIGLLHLDRRDNSRAIETLTLALGHAEEIGLTSGMREIHGHLTHAYEQRTMDGDMDLAFAHLKKAVELNEQLMSAERQRKIAEMEMRAAIERAEREHEQERARSERLALENQHRVEELNALGVHLAERSELIAMIGSELHRALDAGDKDREEIIHGLAKMVAERGKTEREWSSFEEKLQTVHHGVLVELARWNPDLRPMELKVCALLRTQLSSKEIASLLSVSERAIEKHRYRIRRKLGLAKEENLVAFLSRFASTADHSISATAE